MFAPSSVTTRVKQPKKSKFRQPQQQTTTKSAHFFHSSGKLMPRVPPWDIRHPNHPDNPRNKHKKMPNGTRRHGKSKVFCRFFSRNAFASLWFCVFSVSFVYLETAFSFLHKKTSSPCQYLYCYFPLLLVFRRQCCTFAIT